MYSFLLLQSVLLIHFVTIGTCQILEGNEMRTRWKSLKCSSDNETVMAFRYCRIKVTRNWSALSINMTFLKKLVRPIIVKLSVSYKYGQIYREVIKVPEFELCGVLKNFNLLPPFMKALFDVLGESIVALLKGCPYSGMMDLMMEVDMNKFPSILPTGMYKFDASAKHPDTRILTFAVEMEIVSSIKTSF